MSTETRHELLRAMLSTGVGVAAALGLVGLTLLFPTTSTIELVWSAPTEYFPVGPGGTGATGPEGPTNCTMLHVQFNASGPVDVWVAPWGAAMYENGMMWSMSPYWASVGPATAGEFAVQVPPSSTGYQVLLLNPSLTVTLGWMQFETAETAC